MTVPVRTVSSTDTEGLADTLWRAWHKNCPLAMATLEGALQDFETAYHVQEAVLAKKGEPTQGYKISLTSAETQRLFDTTEPLYGAQIPSRLLPSPAVVHLASMNAPLIEVEIAMRAKADLTPEMSLDVLLQNVTIAGDIEVPDARFRDWFPRLNKYLVVADCAVGGYIVYGRERDGATMHLEDMAHIEVELWHNGRVIRRGQSSEVLGNPMNALAWLVNKLHQHGKVLRRGTLVSTGTFFVPPALKAGLYEAHFTGALTETVTLTVTP